MSDDLKPCRICNRPPFETKRRAGSSVVYWCSGRGLDVHKLISAPSPAAWNALSGGDAVFHPH